MGPKYREFRFLIFRSCSIYFRVARSLIRLLLKRIHINGRYFMIAKKGLELDGSTPTLLYGYGGFEISLGPRYIDMLDSL